MKKRASRVLVLLAATILWVGWRLGDVGHQDKVTAQFERDRARLEELALTVLEQGNTDHLLVPSGWRGIELYGKYSGAQVVEFSFDGSGFGSSTTCWGVNYVPDDRPLGFQGDTWDYWKIRGEGRLYYEPEGDNTCYVQRLAPCWYYYEARF